MFRFLLKFSWICTFLLAFAALALAAPQAGLRGTVSDPSGAVIANATVEVLENGVPVAAVVTDQKGQYSIARKLETGSRLRFSASCFRTVEKAIEPQVNGGELALDVTLPVTSFSEQITVVSTGTPVPQSQLGASVTEMDSSEYQGTRETQEALRYVPGIQVTQSGQAGATTGMYIRGGASDANKVLIDGIPMNDIGGNVEFANVASAAVAQVEVLRGPNSVLYGADALAGVVSLTTARGSTPQPLITYVGDAGNFATYRQEGTIGAQAKQFDYFADYARFATNNSLPDNKFHNGTFAGNFGWQLTPASSLRATVHHDQVASGTPGAIPFYGLVTLAKQANEDAYFGVTWQDKTTAKWNNLVRYGGMRLRSNYTQFEAAGIPQYFGGVLEGYLGNPVTIKGANGYSVSGQAQIFNPLNPELLYPTPTDPYTYPTSTDKDFVYAQSDYRLNPHMLALVAFHYEDERGYAVSSAPGNYRERGNYDYTLELQGDIKSRLFYTLGGGLENNGLFGFAATPRASLAWQVASNTKLRASFGKGIKEPNLAQQIESLYDTLIGQPGGSQIISQDHIAPIGPEDSRTFDGGIDQYLFGGRSRLSLSLFHNEFTHEIEYVSPQELHVIDPAIGVQDALTYWPNGAQVNSEAYRAQGVEAEVESQVTRDWFVRAGYTYVDARIQQSLSSSAICPPPPYNPLNPGCYNPLFPSIQIGAYSPLVGARPFRIAPHTGYFQAGYRHQKLYVALSGTLVSRRDDSDFLESSDANYGNTLLLPNRNLDPAYQKLDMTASYQATRSFAFESNFQNLLCEHYQEAFGYPALPFMFRVGFKLTLGGNTWEGK